MHWGRSRQNPKRKQAQELSRGARAVLITGTLICALFFIAAPNEHTDPAYDRSAAAAAQGAFRRDHAVLANLLGLETDEAIAAGAFGIDDVEERWTFSAYLRDAFRVLLFGEAS